MASGVNSFPLLTELAAEFPSIASVIVLLVLVIDRPSIVNVALEAAVTSIDES